MEYSEEILKQRVRAARKLAKMTQDDVAKKLGVSRPFVTQIESGDSGLSLKTLFAISRALGVTSDYILGLSADPQPMAGNNKVEQTVTITLSPEEAIELKKLLAERAEGRVDGN